MPKPTGLSSPVRSTRQSINQSVRNYLEWSKWQCHCLYESACNWVQLWYTIQHRTVLIIFPFILQTVIMARILSTAYIIWCLMARMAMDGQWRFRHCRTLDATEDYSLYRAVLYVLEAVKITAARWELNFISNDVVLVDTIAVELCISITNLGTEVLLPDIHCV